MSVLCIHSSFKKCVLTENTGYHIYVESKKHNKLVNMTKEADSQTQRKKISVTSGKKEVERGNLRVESGKHKLSGVRYAQGVVQCWGVEPIFVITVNGVKL